MDLDVPELGVGYSKANKYCKDEDGDLPALLGTLHWKFSLASFLLQSWFLVTCHHTCTSPSFSLCPSLCPPLICLSLLGQATTSCPPLPCPSLQEDDMPYPVEPRNGCDTSFVQRHVTAGDAGYIMQKISKSEHGSSPLFPHPDGIPERIFPGSLDLGARQGRLDGAKCTYRFKEKSCFLWICLTWSGHLWLSIILFFPF